MISTVKQVLVIRKDLNMRKGKMCSQASHSSSMALLERGNLNSKNELVIPLTDDCVEWLLNGYKKICVGVDSEAELVAIFEAAKEKGLICHLVTDSGRTEFKGMPTITACSIGPNKQEEIDPLTSHLDLL